jgi:Ca2+-binding EF-hand superfamily protein
MVLDPLKRALQAGAAIIVMSTTASAADSVDLATFQADARTKIMAADANKDGVLSESEWSARRDTVLGSAGRQGAAGNVPRVFRRLDTNGDGKLDASEIDAITAERFKRIDADHDGKVTQAERAAAQERGRERLRELGAKRKGGSQAN